MPEFNFGSEGDFVNPDDGIYRAEISAVQLSPNKANDGLNIVWDLQLVDTVNDFDDFKIKNWSSLKGQSLPFTKKDLKAASKQDDIPDMDQAELEDFLEKLVGEYVLVLLEESEYQGNVNSSVSAFIADDGTVDVNDPGVYFR